MRFLSEIGRSLFRLVLECRNGLGRPSCEEAVAEKTQDIHPKGNYFPRGLWQGPISNRDRPPQSWLASTGPERASESRVARHLEACQLWKGKPIPVAPLSPRRILTEQIFLDGCLIWLAFPVSQACGITSQKTWSSVPHHNGG